jgi:hypothetical protein
LGRLDEEHSRRDTYPLKRIAKCWLLIAIIVTGLSGLIYAAIQQDIRQSANDPQIQMAEDAATKLTDGAQVQTVVPSEKVDIAKSLAPYLIVFDATGKPIASSALLDVQIPIIPPGVFNDVRQNGEDRFTWQPQLGVRSAVVVTQFQGSHPGFVLAGRSLREVEIREDHILWIVIAGCVSMLLVTLVATVVVLSMYQRSTPSSGQYGNTK